MSMETINATAPQTPRQITDEDQLRAGAWSLLGALLAGPPDDQVLEALRGIAADPSDDDMAEGWRALQQMAEGAEPARLRREYEALFIGAPEGELTPYASWYISGALMEKPLVRARQALRMLGYERQEGISEPEDHAGALCEVMGQVVLDEELSFEQQRAFFQEHLDPWIGDLFTDMQHAKTARDYRAVGLFGERFLAVERRYLSMLV